MGIRFEGIPRTFLIFIACSSFHVQQWIFLRCNEYELAEPIDMWCRSYAIIVRSATSLVFSTNFLLARLSELEGIKV
jgi:hypothetical protein